MPPPRPGTRLCSIQTRLTDYRRSFVHGITHEYTPNALIRQDLSPLAFSSLLTIAPLSSVLQGNARNGDNEYPSRFRYLVQPSENLDEEWQGRQYGTSPIVLLNVEEHVKKTSQSHGRCFHLGSAPLNDNNPVEPTSPFIGGGSRAKASNDPDHL